MATEIVDGVYDLTCRLEDSGKRYRAFLIDDELPTLVDVAFEETAENLFAEVDEVGIEPERLVITHGHGDHIGGFDAVVDRYDPETWVPENTMDNIGSSGFHDVEVTATPDHTYADRDSIGGFEAVRVPGHCPDNHALIHEDRGVAVMGDVMFGADMRGLPEGYLLPPPEPYSQDHQAAERNLERLVDYDFDVALVFHGTSVVEGAVEKVDKFVNFLGRMD